MKKLIILLLAALMTLLQCAESGFEYDNPWDIDNYKGGDTPVTYTLTVGRNDASGGDVSRNPGKSAYDAGEAVTVTATAKDGYGFTGWSGAVTGTTNPVTIIMDANKRLTASFEWQDTTSPPPTVTKYELTVNTNPAAGGSVSLDPDLLDYEKDAAVTATATASTGYRFTGWSDAANGTTNPVMITMNGNKTLTAEFVRVYTITFNVNGGNALTTNTATTGIDGKLASLPEEPSRNGYTFKGWWTVSTTTGGTQVTTGTIFSEDAIIYARWEEVVTQPTTYTLTVTRTDGGTTYPASSWSNIPSGMAVTIEATAASGYNFVNWTVTTGTATFANASSATTTVTLSSNTTIRANFQRDFTDTVGGVTFSMVYVEGGRFEMGCTSEQGSDCYDGEKPAHTVTLSNGYYVGRHEVTQGLWKAVMGSLPSSISSSYGMGDNYPVYYVSWNDIQTFITELRTKTGRNYRLPTEAEWEFAARGGNSSLGYIYSGSGNIGDVAWYSSNSSSSTHQVGIKQPNELGIYDMSGNVWEWVSDRYGSYSSGAQTNPTGPMSGSNRVYRGGSWDDDARFCRVSLRAGTPDRRIINFGFRLAVSP